MTATCCPSAMSAFMNADIAEGQHVAVIGLHAVEQFRSPKGLDILGPGHFGFEEIDYTPIEELVR